MNKDLAMEVLNAISDIVSVHAQTIVTKTKESAEVLSEIVLKATQYETGAITGPFIVGGNPNIKHWHVDK